MPFLAAVLTGTSKYVAHCLNMCSILVFMLIQYTDYLARSHFFSIPMWLLCSWSSICFCNEKGIITHLSFIVTPIITARSCLIGQYLPKVGSKSSLFCGYPLVICACSICSSASILIAVLMSFIDVQTGMSIVMLSVCILMLIPAISWSLFSVWLWQDSQSALWRSGPGLYDMHSVLLNMQHYVM